MKTERCGFTIHYQNLALLEATAKEIFDDTQYAFESLQSEPFIIDVGSSIGLATLYFKHHYPSAKILCFEPDPTSFDLLAKNIASNNLQDVTLINAAVSKKSGQTNLYGQIFSEQPDSRGNSIVDLWANQRQKNDTLSVNAVRLSSYINSEVDLLKIDIEGAEQQILEELKEKLHYIKEIFIEVHTIELMDEINSLDKVIEILNRSGFKVSYVDKTAQALFPIEINEWVKQNDPKLFFVRAKRKS